MNIFDAFEDCFRKLVDAKKPKVSEADNWYTLVTDGMIMWNQKKLLFA